MGIQFCTIKGLPLLGPSKMLAGNLGKSSSHESHLSQNAKLIFGKKHLCDKEIQFCANKVPGVINDPDQGEHISFYRHTFFSKKDWKIFFTWTTGQNAFKLS